jgi:hypothetical protein
MEWMTEEKPRYKEGLLDPEESYDESRSLYRLTGRFDLKQPEISWKKQYSGEDIIMTAAVAPGELRNVILTIRHNGMIGQAYFDGKLVSDHAYGKFLPWEICLNDFPDHSGELKIFCTKATECELQTAVQEKRVISFY